MLWINVNGMYLNVEHLQTLRWSEGTLFLHASGRSVPEMVSDPERTIYNGLIEYLERRLK